MLRPFGLASVVVIGGCSLFTSFDGVSGGDDPPAGGADASTADTGGGSADDGGGGATDAGGSADVSADVDASLPNLQPNGGFELVNAGGCGAEWGVFQGSGTRVTGGRTGTYACKACGTANTADGNYSLNNGDSANIAVKPGQRYVVEAWVRALDDNGTVQTARGVIRIYASGSTTVVVQRVDPPAVALTKTWTRLETTLDINVDGRFNYYVSFNQGPAGSCALVDDVVVQRIW